MRIKYLVQSIAAVKLRKIFSLIYQIKKHSPRIIGQIYYEAHLFDKLNEVINTQLHLFKGTNSLPDQYGIGLSERIVELPWFLSRVPAGGGHHLDAGSAINFESILFHPKLKTKDIIIVNLNPERNCYWTKSVSYVYADLRKSLFTENCFDSISCISTLEHIGLDNRRWKEGSRQQNKNDYLLVIKEFKRILKKGGKCLVTIPFGKRKNLGWLQIFDKKMMQQVVTLFQPSSFNVCYYKYGAHGWQLSTQKECLTCGYSKSYPGEDLCVGAYSVACLELSK